MKKLLSLIICLEMLFSVLAAFPTSAFATDEVTPLPSTDPVLAISSVTIDAGDPTATFGVYIYNNPGIWSLQTFVIYDRAMSYAGFALGDAFPPSSMPLSPANESYMRDKDVDATLRQPIFSGLDDAFAAQGADYAGKLMTIVQFENNGFFDITNDGLVYSLTLNTASLAPGVYDIFLTYNPDSSFNIDWDFVSFDVVHGTLTVAGEAGCPHSETENVNVVPAGCTTTGSHDVRCTLCGETIETGVTDPALGHDYVASETVEPDCDDEGYTVFSCSRCGDWFCDDFVPELGHFYNVDYTIDVQPTQTTPGSRSRICERCGFIDAADVLYCPGDVNGDGKINTQDLKLIKKSISGSVSENQIAAVNIDTNGDGKTNVADLKAIKQMIAGEQ